MIHICLVHFDVNHKRDICVFYDNIICALDENGQSVCKQVKNNYAKRPGWNRYVAGYYEQALEATKEWDLAGRPRHGPIFENKKLTNARYKYAIRFISKNEQSMRSDSLASKLLSNNVVGFWKEVRSLSSVKASLPCTVDGITGSENIVECWRRHYSSLFNCVHYDGFNVDRIVKNDCIAVTAHEVFQAIQMLPANKTCGANGIYAEHLVHASIRLSPLLAICFSSCLTHGVLPDSLLSIILVPVIKDKAGRMGSLDNYRPIALASIVSKVLERILLGRIQDLINSPDNQFGFKSKHGTDLCIFALKEMIGNHKNKNSTVLMCFIDASKAFNRVNHGKLFLKMSQRGVRQYILRILAYWYAHQVMQVKWGNSVSGPFRVGNGVRQGGILSPVLFCLYMSDLSQELNACRTGCMIGSTLVNHLMYADDLVVLSPSSEGLQELLNVCSKYGVEFDVKYNPCKSVIMICRTKEDKSVEFPRFTLCGNDLTVCHKYKYLGHFITEDLSDDEDIYRQCRMMYAQANTLVRRFGACTAEVKKTLFKAYCTALYTAHLWSNYKRVSIRKLNVAYNDCLRILLKKPRWESASQMLVSAGVKTFYAALRCLMHRFICRLNVCENIIIRSLTSVKLSATRYQSELWRHWYSCLL